MKGTAHNRSVLAAKKTGLKLLTTVLLVSVIPIEQALAQVDYSQLVNTPLSNDLNPGLTSPDASYMRSVLGKPGELTEDCSPITNPNLEKLIINQNVGPFTVTGYKPAVEAIGRIFAQVKQDKPELYSQLETAGMLCVRKVRNGSDFSNHSWGTAIDIKINGTLDEVGDGKTQLGLKELYPYFHQEGFYWGAAYSGNREDSMHFEASEQLVAKWISSENPPPVLETPASANYVTPVPADYDGDGKADLSVKTNGGTWFVDYASNSFGKWDASYSEYGGTDAIPVPADYDGDGKADLSVKTNGGTWFIDYASNSFGKWDASYSEYGGTDAIPVPADYDGDGKADLSVKTNGGTWFIDYASNSFGKWDASYSEYGGTDAIPVPADYDGDGKADLSVKTNGGTWFVDYASNSFGKWDASYSEYGGTDAIPVPADYDGDGKADLSVKTNGGTWFVDYASNSFGKWDASYSEYGGTDAIPVPADYDGDGKADLSVKTNGGTWFIDYASNSFGKWDASYSEYGLNHRMRRSRVRVG